jgi:hypothetical protein
MARTLEELEREVERQDREIRTLNRCLTGMANFLRIAANYQHDDPVARLDGIQAALL